jgi:hypothetical protein
MQWQPIETAPRDGRPIDVWLGGDDASPEDLRFYCGDGETRRSTNWHWFEGKFRPMTGLKLPVFVQPTHWMPLPLPPGE